MYNLFIIKKPQKIALLYGAAFLFIAVLLGAFGAHALEQMISEKKLLTFQTGIRYQFYHALALILCATVSVVFRKVSFNKVFAFYIIGILLFSFNCYLYALSGIKAFAMIVPLGGVSFLIGHALLVFIFFTKVEVSDINS